MHGGGSRASASSDPSAARRSPPGCASDRARSASNASARRTRGRPPPGGAGAGSRTDRPLAEVGELAHPGDRLAAVGQVRRALGPVLRDPVPATRPLRRAACWPPARSICWNQSQAAAGQLVGELLDVPGAAGRVDHPGQVRLVEQDRLGVAGDPAGEVVRQAERAVEGQHGDRVGAADPGAPGRRPWCAACSPTGRARSSSRPRSPRAGAAPRRPRTTPQTSATRDHRRRAARSLAMVRNWSALAA